MLMRATLALLLLAAACGTGTDGTPVAPPTTPALAPEPAPPPTPPPTVRAVLEIWSNPGEPGGYYPGERIVAVARFEERTTVVGSPQLRIEIGDHVRLAEFSPWIEDDFPPDRPSWLQRFEYRIADDDRDADGISVPEDAFDFTDGALLAAGVEIEVEVSAVLPQRSSSGSVAPGEPVDAHPVLGTPEPRTCTDERERALNHSRFVMEWDGTPFRVDVIRNFPDFVTEADLAELLPPVGLLDEKIEQQLGYRIVKSGQVIPLPEGLPPGWNADIPDFARNCPLPRDPRQIHTIYMNDAPSSAPTAGAQAYPRCGAWAILAYRVGNGWPGLNYDETVLHELFHIFGFVHADDHDRLARGDGVPMSEQLTSRRPVALLGADGVLWSDIDYLRCIFPEGG